VQNGPHMDGAGQGRIEVGYYGPNDVVLFVETDAPALLVLSDTFYPGWQAEVDGERAPIYRTNAVFRGVLVPPGKHRVEMTFRPSSLRWSLMIWDMGLLILITGTTSRSLRGGNA
ncbi:MAG: YfhO family protein, partial [Anaerolineae bacterium]